MKEVKESVPPSRLLSPISAVSLVLRIGTAAGTEVNVESSCFKDISADNDHKQGGDLRRKVDMRTYIPGDIPLVNF